MVEAGESEYSAILKTGNLLIFRDAQNAENSKIAANWNVSGTRDFSFARQNPGMANTANSGKVLQYLQELHI